MDDSTETSATTARPEGFAGQRLCVLPRPRVAEALAAPATRRLVVTDAGYFPHASGHRRTRTTGVPETIVILCVAGRGTVRIGDDTTAVGPGTCITIPALAPHDYWASDDPWTIWWMHLRGSDVAELVAPLPGLGPTVRRVQGLDRVSALFDELVSTMERPPSDARLLAASGVAWNLLSRLAVDAVLPAEGTPLERAMRYLEARVDGSVSVTELAALVGISPSHLGALFREATGGGPASYHSSLRMARARSLLDTTSMPVGQVATAVGYLDPLYFSRQFRRTHDVSPSEYRALRKG
ncbi:helix-turn-helix domain-containing protein [uncultured Demequina sp.]|uniref:helix-turn-helix domain-containing protein n=1 Tax=uncultured Demequina sp. TaxID=693499 RepID=UPI0025DBE879|nr:helix-turn-helix domain-containing protein [uncultured Demequina sp.]